VRVGRFLHHHERLPASRQTDSFHHHHESLGEPCGEKTDYFHHHAFESLREPSGEKTSSSITMNAFESLRAPDAFLPSPP